MQRRLSVSIRRLVRHRGEAAFVIAALLVGLGVGLVAAALVTAIEITKSAADVIKETAGRWALIAFVPTGLLIAWTINRRWGPGLHGGGVSETMVGLSVRSGYMPTRTIFAKIAATAATLGFGGSGGREGPAVQLGATVGSSLARYTRFGEDRIRSLVAAGAGAGIGASFNAPIAGMLFALEVLLGNLAIRHLNAVVVASVAAAVTTRSLVGAERILSAPAHVLAHPAELVLYAGVGVVAFLATAAFLRVVTVAEQRPRIASLPDWSRAVTAGALVAAVGLVEPDVLGTGQEFVGRLLRLEAGTSEVWWVLGALAAAKIFTYALTLYGDGSAGEFMPSLFIGAALGAGFAVLVSPFWGFSTLSPGAFAVVGMAATFGAVARAPLTSILIVFEITGDYGLVLPLMLASSLATFLIDRINPDSAYTLPLKLRGIHLPRREDVDLLDTVSVGDVMSHSPSTCDPSMTTREALAVLDAGRHHGLPVTSHGRLVGIFTLTDVKASGGPSDSTKVGEVMTPKPITVTPSLPVSAALARMAALEVGRMPVVDDDDPSRLVGMFRRESVVHAYHQALGATTDRAIYRRRLQQKVAAGATFFELSLSPNSDAVGSAVRDVEWPETVTLVSVRRGDAVLIPHGDTVLAEGDVLTLFGTGAAREEAAWVLEPKSNAG